MPRTPLDTSAFKLAGGGRQRGNSDGGHSCPDSAITWNPGTLDDQQLLNAVGLGAAVVALQETGLSQRSQKRMQNRAKDLGWQLLCGPPAPLVRNKGGKWRADRSQAPGVALPCERPNTCWNGHPKN